jgi:GTP cyclohydrolase I
MLPLLDVQARPDERGVTLTQAGIRGVELPWAFCDALTGMTQPVPMVLAMTVSLPCDIKGAHMSRFVRDANHWRGQAPLSLQNLRPLLSHLTHSLQAPTAQLTSRFTWFVDKTAPVSQLIAPMGYNVVIRAALKESQLTAHVQLIVPIATLCPCSKEISDYGAHNQRAFLTVTLDVAEEALGTMSLTQLITQLETTASCPVFPILKREDEKWVTEHQYDHPQFVEDVVRDAVVLLRKQAGLKGFYIAVEALESIHAHNAFAQTAEGSLSDAILL